MLARFWGTRGSIPVTLTSADIDFIKPDGGKTTGIAGFGVTPKRQRHTVDCYGYRFERAGQPLRVSSAYDGMELDV